MRKGKPQGFGQPEPHPGQQRAKSSYTWVEKSQLTGKWLVMATLPHEDSRCLLVFTELSQARQVAIDLEKQVRKIPRKDWRKRTQKYQRFLRALPDDDDAPYAAINRETGEIVPLPEIQALDLGADEPLD